MTPDEMLERIDGMEKRPLMWAATCEGYVMQLWVLLEVMGVESEKLRDKLGVKILGNGLPAAVNCDKPLTEEFAKKTMVEVHNLLTDLAS